MVQLMDKLNSVMFVDQHSFALLVGLHTKAKFYFIPEHTAIYFLF